MVEVAKFALVILKLKMRNILVLITTFLLCLPGLAQNESPGRGLVVAKGQKEGQYFVSWRLLKSDPQDAPFTLLRDGKVYQRNITGATSLVVEGTPASRWQVIGAGENVPCKAVLPWTQPYLTLHVSVTTLATDIRATSLSHVISLTWRTRRTIRVACGPST